MFKYSLYLLWNQLFGHQRKCLVNHRYVLRFNGARQCDANEYQTSIVDQLFHKVWEQNWNYSYVLFLKMQFLYLFLKIVTLQFFLSKRNKIESIIKFIKNSFKNINAKLFCLQTILKLTLWFCYASPCKPSLLAQ